VYVDGVDLVFRILYNGHWLWHSALTFSIASAEEEIEDDLCTKQPPQQHQHHHQPWFWPYQARPETHLSTNFKFFFCFIYFHFPYLPALMNAP